MAAKLKITSRSAGAIRHAGTATRSVTPDVIAKALGADKVVSRTNVHGAPISLHALRRQLERAGFALQAAGRLWKGQPRSRRFR